MGKPKQFLKESKKRSKHAPQVPTTADEYLAAGVDFEEAGEKWRGGDAVKSTRFFVRAIDCYDEGLRKFPTSFDLAYNKARVQYELTQHPKLLKHLPGSLLDLLQTALESSRYALNLKQDDADVLFNTAQVLTSLFEALDDQQAYTLLEEALLLFQRCLDVQEAQYEQFESQLKEISGRADINNNSMETESTPLTIPTRNSRPNDQESPSEEQWASVVVPVSKEAILDTILAFLETLTDLIGFSENSLPFMEKFGRPILEKKLPFYASGTDKSLEAEIVGAKLVSTEIGARFKIELSGPGDLEVYCSMVRKFWASLDLKDNVEGLCKRAEAYITCSNNLRIAVEGNMGNCNTLRWGLLTEALRDLTAASKFKEDENVVKIYLEMGNVEMSRYQLGREPRNLDVAVKNKGTLLKNAEKHYRSAGILIRADDPEEYSVESKVKETLTKALDGDYQSLVDIRGLAQQGNGVLVEAVEEGIFSWEQLDLD